MRRAESTDGYVVIAHREQHGEEEFLRLDIADSMLGPERRLTLHFSAHEANHLVLMLQSEEPPLGWVNC